LNRCGKSRINVDVLSCFVQFSRFNLLLASFEATQPSYQVSSGFVNNFFKKVFLAFLLNEVVPRLTCDGF
ncbi:hypothetical protein ACKA06_18890, partial [Rossellomorea oryzaecorticis]